MTLYTKSWEATALTQFFVGSGAMLVLTLTVLQVARANPLSVRWLPAARGEVPRLSVEAGRTSDGRPLYACRVFNGDLVHDGWHRFQMTAGVVSHVYAFSRQSVPRRTQHSEFERLDSKLPFEPLWVPWNGSKSEVLV